MKTIIDELTLTEIKSIATVKWHEYAAAEKIHRLPEYTDLKKAYNQIRKGRKIIDITKVIEAGGLHDNQMPRLAIAKAMVKTIFLQYYTEGTANFINRPRWNGSKDADQLRNEDVSVRLEPFSKDLIPHASQWSSKLCGLAPVPIIPVKHLPRTGLKDTHYILWEVDEWKMVPPTDPYLLERITKTLFVVLASWDLTPLEKSVMAGRMKFS